MLLSSYGSLGELGGVAQNEGRREQAIRQLINKGQSVRNMTWVVELAGYHEQILVVGLPSSRLIRGGNYYAEI